MKPGEKRSQHRGKHRCETCGGVGRVPGMRKVTGLGSGMGSAYGPCPDCDGTGWVTFHGDHDEGRVLALDRAAESADVSLPAFLARPKDAPVYYGFPILDDVEVDGFRLGMITDWEAEPSDVGDAFVVAPDNSRCGLVWEVTNSERFDSILDPEPARWGVWGVGLPHPMNTRENARKNLAALLPRLRQQWEAWRETNERDA